MLLMENWIVELLPGSADGGGKLVCDGLMFEPAVAVAVAGRGELLL